MSPRRSILVLFAHPALEKSRVNRRLAAAVRELEGVAFHDLYELYPEFDVDIRSEQRLLETNDVVVLQHPLYWYGTPALVKQWQDLVLEHGWAYGREGTALRGKLLVNVVTVGGGASAYRRGGQHGHSLQEYLLPLVQSARLCGMETLPPFAVFGTHSMVDTEIEAHAADYARLVGALRDDVIDLERVRRHDILNGYLDEIRVV